MGILDSINHLVNFALPALAVALALPVLARLSAVGRVVRPGMLVQSLVNFLAGVAVLSAGVWFWGRDGTMSTYLAMAAVCATTQWALLRAWRR